MTVLNALLVLTVQASTSAVRVNAAPPHLCVAEIVRALSATQGVTVSETAELVVGVERSGDAWRLLLQRSDGVVLERTLSGADCGAVALATAVVVERYLHDIEAQAAARRVRGTPKAETKPTPAVPPAAGNDRRAAAKKEARAAARDDARSASNNDARPVSNNDARPVSNNDARPVSNNDARPVSNNDARPVSNNDARPVSNRDASPVSSSTSGAATDVEARSIGAPVLAPVTVAAASTAPPSEDPNVNPAVRIGVRPAGSEPEPDTTSAAPAPDPVVSTASRYSLGVNRLELQVGGVAWAPSTNFVNGAIALELTEHFDPAWKLSLFGATTLTLDTAVVSTSDNNIPRGILYERSVLGLLTAGRCFGDTLRGCGSLVGGVRAAYGWSTGNLVFTQDPQWLAIPTFGFQLAGSWVPRRIPLVFTLGFIGLWNPVPASFTINGISSATLNLPSFEGLLSLSIGFGIIQHH